MDIGGRSTYNLNSMRAGHAYSNQSIIGEGLPAGASLKSFNNLTAGDYFKGHIVSMEQDAVKILLSNQQVINARLDLSILGSETLAPGQDIIFQVNDNANGKISIKPYMIEKYPVEVLLKALDAAKLPPSEKNIDIVKALIDKGMSIDKNTLHTIIQENSRFSGENLNEIITLHKLQVPVTEENIGQLKSYMNYESSISKQVDIVANDIANILTEGSADSVNKLGSEILGFATNEKGLFDNINSAKGELIENNPLGANLDNENSQLLVKSEIRSEGVRGELDALGQTRVQEGYALINKALYNINAINENTSIATENIEQILKADNKLSNMMATEIANQIIMAGDTDKEQLFALKNAINTLNDNGLEHISAMVLKNKDIVKKLKDTIKHQLSLSPEELLMSKDRGENVKELYGKIHSLAEAIDRASTDDSSMATLREHSNDLRGNSSFMNQLNSNHTYLQLPVKLQNEFSSGELYVYGKRRNEYKKGEELTAFLHFDLDNLGATDIRVAMVDNKVNISFSLESGSSTALVEKNLITLKEALEKKGYTATLRAEQIPEATKAFDKLLEDNSNANTIKRYSFDVAR